MPDDLWALVEPLLPSPVGVAPLMPVVGARRMVWPYPNGLIHGRGITRLLY